MNTRTPRCFPVLAHAAGLCTATLLSLGCQTSSTAEHPHNPALRRIELVPGASEADADRAALSRLVGVWNFEGWAIDPAGKRTAGAGNAAGVIEDEHFVLLDLQITSGQMGGRAGRKAGSMLFASEPGIGLTLTGWGDAAPSISRLVGRVEGNGSAIKLHESRTPEGRHRHSMTIIFETDDRWTAEIRDETAGGKPLVASYRFTRSA